MKIIIPYVVSLISLVIIDAVWLKLMATFYREKLAHIFADTFSFTPALFFYPLYALALTLLVIWPALKNGSSTFMVVGLSALLGLAAYGAYDLTNAATIKNWPLSVTVIDMLWGATLTAISGLVAFSLFRIFS